MDVHKNPISIDTRRCQRVVIRKQPHTFRPTLSSNALLQVLRKRVQVRLAVPLGVALVLLVQTSLPAAGPVVSHHLLGYGGSQILIAPTLQFAREIDSMELVKSPYRARPATNSHPTDVAAAELSDLKLALQANGRSPASIERILSSHQVERETILSAVEALASSPPTAPMVATQGMAPITVSALSTGAVHVVKGLPPEFADYFRGAIAWHGAVTNLAIAAWESLLKRPEHERRFRSTWAAFMLGKALWQTEPRRAIRYFQQVRSLALEGYSDSLGLAAASLGWEARIELRREHFERAIDLYLEQAAAGDSSAYHSLWCAASLAQKSRSVRALARHPRAQRVITAYVISGGWRDQANDTDNIVREFVTSFLEKQNWYRPANGWHRFEYPTAFWLEAVEAANIRDADSAEKLALAAYQFGDQDASRRWLERAGPRPVCQWLQSKLALDEGRLEVAFMLLSNLVHRFPVKDASDDGSPSAKVTELLFDRLLMSYWNQGWDARRQIQAELAGLQLVRRSYRKSLEAFLRSGHWNDAAYVADRVLNVDELKSFVDDSGHAWVSPTAPGPHDWLAWRLIRAKRFQEARSYLREEEQLKLDSLLTTLAKGRDPRLPRSERASALRAAANGVMSSGMSFFNPPVQTDWGLNPAFWITNTVPYRLQASAIWVLPITDDEERRVQESSVYPRRDWHHRYIAAELAWDAASLMSDNSIETAQLLWQAGTWLKYADPNAADRFYKALVRRCGQTLLGREADRRRWLPPETTVAGLMKQP